MKRHVFIAIDLPSELKQKVADFVSNLSWLPIRWINRDNWHITLIPPVYLEDRELESLISLLGKSRLGRSFFIEFSRILLAPPGVQARMIWLEGDTPPDLLRLEKRLKKLLPSKPELTQLKSESRTFKLHVTLARFEPGDLRELEDKNRILGEINFVFEAKELAVVESRLKQSGAGYETIGTVRLGV